VVEWGQMLEIERRFLVAGDPPLDLATETHRMVQGYLAVEPSYGVRVRSTNDEEFYLSVKLLTAGDPLRRQEVEGSITSEDFRYAMEAVGDRVVRKRRSIIPLGEHRAEVDVFEDNLDGLVMVEVEFDDDRQAKEFDPPPWFGEEVTDDHRFSNAALAVAQAVPTPEG
jgi:adenylate cyclase